MLLCLALTDHFIVLACLSRFTRPISYIKAGSGINWANTGSNNPKTGAAASASGGLVFPIAAAVIAIAALIAA